VVVGVGVGVGVGGGVGVGVGVGVGAGAGVGNVQVRALKFASGLLLVQGHKLWEHGYAHCRCL